MGDTRQVLRATRTILGGVEKWQANGVLHRDDGPAVVYPGGTVEWFHHGKRHRDDGPAIIYADGSQWWFRHGELHRDDGPAVVRPDGFEAWWVNGNQVDPSPLDQVAWMLGGAPEPGGSNSETQARLVGV